MEKTPESDRPILITTASHDQDREPATDVARSIDGIKDPLNQRLTKIFSREKQPEQVQTIIEGLTVLGIDTAPDSNEFIRYYPPLREIPVVQAPQRIDLSNLKGDLALFMYIPFCTGRCSYCFYPKQVDVSQDTVDSYIETLKSEIALFISTIPPEISSIYVGGGTPSILSVKQLDKLFGELEIPKAASSSMTCEVSPETITEEKIAALKRHGVTRISMGIQSLDDRILQATGRRYDSEEAKIKIRLLGDSIDSYNLDFIYGLEGQEMEDLRNILKLVTEVQPPSVTFYQQWTAMHDRLTQAKQGIATSSMNDMVEMRILIAEVMASVGYEQDSLFRFVKKSNDGCSYCRTVWADNSCIATGLSAYSYINGRASQNTYSMDQYRDMVESGYSPIRRAKQLTIKEQATRALVLGLKTAGANCKLNVRAIEEKYDVTCTQETKKLLESLSELGVMEMQNGIINFTDVGVAFAEKILAKLMEQTRFADRDKYYK